MDPSVPAGGGSGRHGGSRCHGGGSGTRGRGRRGHDRDPAREGHPRGPLGPDRQATRAGPLPWESRALLLGLRLRRYVPHLDPRMDEEETRRKARHACGEGGVPRVERLPRGPPRVQVVARRAVATGEGAEAGKSRGGDARSHREEGQEGELMAERTFVLLKPDAVQRGLIGEVVSRFERRGLKITAMRFVRVTRSLAETYDAEHKGKVFFEPLMSYVAAGPVVAMVLEGDGAGTAGPKRMGEMKSPAAGTATIS